MKNGKIIIEKVMRIWKEKKLEILMFDVCKIKIDYFLKGFFGVNVNISFGYFVIKLFCCKFKLIFVKLKVFLLYM